MPSCSYATFSIGGLDLTKYPVAAYSGAEEREEAEGGAELRNPRPGGGGRGITGRQWPVNTRCIVLYSSLVSGCSPLTDENSAQQLLAVGTIYF